MVIWHNTNHSRKMSTLPLTQDTSKTTQTQLYQIGYKLEGTDIEVVHNAAHYIAHLEKIRNELEDQVIAYEDQNLYLVNYNQNLEQKVVEQNEELEESKEIQEQLKARVEQLEKENQEQKNIIQILRKRGVAYVVENNRLQTSIQKITETANKEEAIQTQVLTMAATKLEEVQKLIKEQHARIVILEDKATKFDRLKKHYKNLFRRKY